MKAKSDDTTSRTCVSQPDKHDFDDEPLPLCLTEPHDGIDRDIAAILRVIFGIHTARGMA